MVYYSFIGAGIMKLPFLLEVLLGVIICVGRLLVERHKGQVVEQAINELYIILTTANDFKSAA